MTKLQALRVINLAFWLWFAWSGALNPVDPGVDYWPAFVAQFFQVGTYDPFEFLGRLALAAVPWFVIDRKLRLRAGKFDSPKIKE